MSINAVVQITIGTAVEMSIGLAVGFDPRIINTGGDATHGAVQSDVVCDDLVVVQRQTTVNFLHLLRYTSSG